MATTPVRGHVPGWNVQDYANAFKDGEFGFSFATMADAKTSKKQWVAPRKGKITGVYVTSANTAAAATATLAVSCNGNNALNAATVALNSLTLNTNTAQTLSSTAANIEFEAGEVIEVTVATSGGSGAITDVECRIHWTFQY